MPAYLLADITWHDESKAMEYRKLLGPSLEKFGAKTLVANAPKVFEGDWNPPRVVIIEFPSMEALENWYRSPDYSEALRVRKEGSTTRLLAVEPPAPR